MADTTKYEHITDTGITGYISKIQLPAEMGGGIYEIHDEKAIHTVEDLGLGAVLIFKGVKENIADLPTTNNKDGDVWHVKENNYEYVWATVEGAGKWEPLGAIHEFNFASSEHVHTVTVTGTNAESDVTGSVIIPTITDTKVYIAAEADAPTFTAEGQDKAMGVDATFKADGGEATIQKLKGTATGATVVPDGTTTVVTGFGEHAKETVISSLEDTTINNPTVTAGSAASWSASVSNGLLSFTWATNVPTAVVTEAVTVATGAKDTKEVIAGLGQATTADVLTGVKMGEQPIITLALGTEGDVDVVTEVSDITISVENTDEVSTISGGTVSAPTVTMKNNGAAGDGVVQVSNVTTGTQSASIEGGKAAAQVWTAGAITVTPPVDAAN